MKISFSRQYLINCIKIRGLHPTGHSAAPIIGILTNAVPNLNLLGPLSMIKYRFSESKYLNSHIVDGNYQLLIIINGGKNLHPMQLYCLAYVK